jgi:hypothetical protein
MTKERVQYYRRNAANRAGNGYLAGEAYVRAEEYALPAKQFRIFGNLGGRCTSPTSMREDGPLIICLVGARR